MKKILSKIKKQFKLENEGSLIITSLHSIYCKKDNKKILFNKNQSFLQLDDDVQLKYYLMLQKSLGGKIGSKIFSMPFENNESQNEFIGLCDNKDSYVNNFVDRILQNYEYDTDILISIINFSVKNPLLKKSKKNNPNNNDYWNFVIGSINMVGPSKQILLIDTKENSLNTERKVAGVVTENSSMGFLYPSIENNGQSFDKILYFTSIKDFISDKFIKVLGCKKILTASQEIDIFNKILLNSFGDTVNENNINDIFRIYKGIASKECNITIDTKQIEKIFKDNGIKYNSDEVNTIIENNIKNTGIENKEVELNINNILPLKKNDLKFSDNDISVNLGCNNLDKIHVKNNQGHKYLVIKIDDNADLNGIKIE